MESSDLGVSSSKSVSSCIASTGSSDTLLISVIKIPSKEFDSLSVVCGDSSEEAGTCDVKAGTCDVKAGTCDIKAGTCDVLPAAAVFTVSAIFELLSEVVGPPLVAVSSDCLS